MADSSITILGRRHGVGEHPESLSRPWSVSSSMSGLARTRREIDVEPGCTVVFGAGRHGDDGCADSHRVELVFEGCDHVRVGLHSDLEGVEAIGDDVVGPFESDVAGFLTRRARSWRPSGLRPDPRFDVGVPSARLAGLWDVWRIGSRHSVVDGRDGDVELIAGGHGVSSTGPGGGPRARPR